MNKVKSWLLAGLLSVGLTACDQQLNVNPVLSIDETTALSTGADVQVTLTGAFDGLSSSNLYGGAILYSGELLGDDREVVFGGTYATLDEIWRKTMTTSNGVVGSIWSSAYATINRANHVLSALDKVDADNKNAVEGQARFIRGVLYFELVKLFGKTYGDGDNNVNLGVPLVLTPTKSVTEADFKPRSTVAAVYAQVLDDLTKAESLLPASTSSSSVVTKSAAQALLSRVYLMQANYTAARDAANKVITSGEYALTSTFADAFNDATSPEEVIFSISVSDQDGANDMNTFYASSLSQGRGDVRVQSKHLALYEAGDERSEFFEVVSKNNFTLKFADQYGDVPIVRLAEMYLTRAECNQRLGATTGSTPLQDVNRIRNRAGLASLATVTLDAILKERKLELAFEGQQLSDIKRLHANVGTKTYSDPALILPIPQREMDTNKQLKQNTGY
jgi:hypothetical protein